ncbi:MAG TPA: heavy metal-binding domain-containing protein [Solirubrobacteraceae bacterium]|nr:heavy metal-binding domain-containing protein [Solirubrobacteraceae bacterium]
MDAEPRESPAQEREDELSLARIEAGDIPLSAERRLQELHERGGSFTSDLSVSGFALCDRLGLKPLSQVMGSAIYQVGYQGATWPTMIGGSFLSELGVLTEAWNEVRRRALNRLELEARHAGADAVVGVEVRTAGHEWAEGAIEYAALGTAVRRSGARRGDQPVLTELTVADYAKLLDAGIEPLGIVAWTSVFFAAYAGNWMGAPVMNPAQSYEMTEFTAAVYSAREQVMGRLGAQAQQRGASGVVGVRIGHSVSRAQVGSANSSRGGAVITFDATGTAVRDEGAAGPRAPKTTIDLTT